MEIFPYEQHELDYLKKQDKQMKILIETIGPLRRAVHTNLFQSLVSSIVSQQISTKAATTINKRLRDCFDGPSPSALAKATVESIQKMGVSFRKANYIHVIAKSVQEGSLQLDELKTLPDEIVIERLMLLPGIGRWTAEMLLIFALLRPNVFSVTDLGIQKGVLRLYGHKELTKERMERYRKRYAPYGSLASLYLWELVARPEISF